MEVLLQRVLVMILFAANLSLNHPGASQEATNCPLLPDSLLQKIVKKIELSQYAKITPLLCADINELNRISPDKFEITTGRKNGEPVICLLESRDQPCKYVLGKLDKTLSPASALSSIFPSSMPISDVLNETVERLFIRPSSIIK